ncbi:hypothetical protein MFRU_040g00350 [Monilinia fructicola]|uniref:Amidohydrolase-related domain-containing protein n=1 Tax=Monilinia fructicola TaxID=38448 RepID=A0A5M9JI21_MONFR|nr:hypothetical protein EYC84_010465 [Monilinia fructicola]KAG4026476.1 hypothetical protein MFRU_040g00350 [Monilinia fructicola]
MYKSKLMTGNNDSNLIHRVTRIRFPLSVILLIAAVLALQLIILPRYVYQVSPAITKLSDHYISQIDSGLEKCLNLHSLPREYSLSDITSRKNPRWNSISGQNQTTVLKNATLFDGKAFLGDSVDITLENGLIKSVSSATRSTNHDSSVQTIDLKGQYVTPGLVDMHSHHLVHSWPQLSITSDENEYYLGPITPFVRALDQLKTDDKATAIIASGGVTTSLLLPGSGNIIGGEGILIKNSVLGGKNGEDVVEDVLLEYGIPAGERRRYMKMACGENPKHRYEHTRGGNAWLFRKQMARGKELIEKQDSWCLSAAAVRESRDSAAISSFMKDGGLPEDLELESTVALLRGKVGVNVHCYETEDIEDMLRHSKEFGFRIQAFHHALSAWKVPELIKSSGENITIAIFSEFGFYKKEAYDSNLWAGSILAEHGLPVAYKSDHVMETNNAKYLIFQAATAHAFNLSESLALQSVTSIPAKSLGIDYRVGYVRPGYDADIVVWDSHPLLAGATPLQVYIDGKSTLDPIKVAENVAGSSTEERVLVKPKQRISHTKVSKETTCSRLNNSGQNIIVNGIKRSYLMPHQDISSVASNLTMVINNGKVICLDSEKRCGTLFTEDSAVIELQDGSVLPGLTSYSPGLGLAEISGAPETSDGSVGKSKTLLEPENIVHAKHGVHLDGVGFSRARLGGVTKVVTAPISGSFFSGVSTGIKTSGKYTILDGGIFQDNVALHFSVGQSAKQFDSIPTVSSAIEKLQQILINNIGKDNIYGTVANGTFPLVVHVDNEYDILQLIKVKNDHPLPLKLVLSGGAGAHLVADEIAKSKTPLILTRNRGAPDTYEKRNALSGPPLTRSPAAVLTDAGVLFALTVLGEGSDSHVHNLAIEAGWAAKYSRLGKHEAVDLVSRNIEKILDLNVVEETRDFVVWEGDPLQLGASVVFSVEGGNIGTCWPTSN